MQICSQREFSSPSVIFLAFSRTCVLPKDYLLWALSPAWPDQNRRVVGIVTFSFCLSPQHLRANSRTLFSNRPERFFQKKSRPFPSSTHFMWHTKYQQFNYSKPKYEDKKKKKKEKGKQKSDENKRKGWHGIYYRRRTRGRKFNAAKVPEVSIVFRVKVDWTEGRGLRSEESEWIGNGIFMQQ